eukprot:759333-Hanusia_phi.AAC.2
MPAWEGESKQEEEEEEEEEEEDGSGGSHSRLNMIPPLTPSHQREEEHGSEATMVSEDKDGFGMCRHPTVDMEGGRGHAALTSLLVLSVYYRTLSPSISGGDSGEVMAAACSGGPAHPPGYPLFVMLARVSMRLFASLGENKAYRVNLMCAMLTAAGVYHLHRAVRAMAGRSSSATLAAGMYGLSPLIWNNALQAEVFALNNFFVCLLTNLLVRYLARERPSSTRVAWIGAFFVGLSLTNQHTLVFYCAIIVPAVLFSGWRQLLLPSSILKCIVLMLLGLSPYSHMWWLEGCPIPWAEKDGQSLGVPACSQGEKVGGVSPSFTYLGDQYSWGDRRSFRGFLNHFLRKDYGERREISAARPVTSSPSQVPLCLLREERKSTGSRYGSRAEACVRMWQVSLLEGIKFYLEDIAGPRLDERRKAGHTKSYEGQLLYLGIPFAVVGRACCASWCCDLDSPLRSLRLLVWTTATEKSRGSVQRQVLLSLDCCSAGRVLVACYLFYIIVFHSLANLPIKVACPAVSCRSQSRAQVPLFLAVHARFWQMPNSTLFLFVGIGFEFLSRRYVDKSGDKRRRNAENVRWAIVLLCIWLQFIKNFEKLDQTGNYAVEFVTRTAIETLPPNAILLCSGDLQVDRIPISSIPASPHLLSSQFNPGLYLTICENVRPDVRFMSLQLMSYRWYALNR